MNIALKLASSVLAFVVLYAFEAGVYVWVSDFVSFALVAYVLLAFPLLIFITSIIAPSQASKRDFERETRIFISGAVVLCGATCFLVFISGAVVLCSASVLFNPVSWYEIDSDYEIKRIYPFR